MTEKSDVGEKKDGMTRAELEELLRNNGFDSIDGFISEYLSEEELKEKGLDGKTDEEIAEYIIDVFDPFSEYDYDYDDDDDDDVDVDDDFEIGPYLPPEKSFIGRGGKKPAEIMRLLFTDEEIDEIANVKMADSSKLHQRIDRVGASRNGRVFLGLSTGVEDRDPQIVKFVDVDPDTNDADVIGLVPVLPGCAQVAVPVRKKSLGDGFGEVLFQLSLEDTYLEMLLPFYVNDTTWFKNNEPVGVVLTGIAESIEVCDVQEGLLKAGYYYERQLQRFQSENPDKTKEDFAGVGEDDALFFDHVKIHPEKSSYVTFLGRVDRVEKLSVAGIPLQRILMTFMPHLNCFKFHALAVYTHAREADKLPAEGDIVKATVLLIGRIWNPAKEFRREFLID